VTKLLIVDDDEQNLYMLQVLLEGHGYEVDTAGDGAEALEKARRDPPDMIISDILMPVMDGFTLCREWLKEYEQLKHIPFVFLHRHLHRSQGRGIRPEPGGGAVHRQAGRARRVCGDAAGGS